MTTLIKFGLNDIIKQINADQAWQKGFTGKGVHIAIIDTGIQGEAKEFSALGKKSPHQWSSSPEIDPWKDSDIHGTMIACVAAANSQSGGRFSGVAPDTT
ncbi:MAG: peptidase S8/S53 subtilisin kexin sedolisin, partial [bacterium]